MAVCYKDILSIDKMIDVYKNIRSNTCHKEKLVRFELAFCCNLTTILEKLENKTYQHQSYQLFLISIPKYRIIMSETIPDKIVNHLVSKYLLLPALTPKLIDMNVATRVGKGTKAGIEYTKKYIHYIKQNHKKVYALKCDIKKYFYYIDHEILMQKLRRDIKDADVICLLENIITSTDQEYVNQYIELLITRETKRLREQKCPDTHRLEELSKIPRYEKGKGLPIGNETSQILAIYYLSSLDHYIKEQLHIKCYVRYMDDFILFHHDKKYLEECLIKIKEELKSLELSLNRKTQIYDLDKGLNFLGYKFVLKNKKLLILLNNQTKKKIKKKLRRLKKHHAPNYEAVKTSYQGYFQVANTKHFLYRSKF